MFTYADAVFAGIMIAIGAEKKANTAFICAAFLRTAGFVGSCGCIEIWRTFDGLDSETEKMVVVIGFTGISHLFLFGLVFVESLLFYAIAGCLSCSSQNGSQPGQGVAQHNGVCGQTVAA